jgi:hypothetical protein
LKILYQDLTAPKGARVAFHPTTKSQWAFTLPSFL